MRKFLQVRELTKKYNYRDKPALSGVSFEVDAGEIVAVTGSSGSGKSTLLGIIGSFIKASSGSVSYNGVPLPTAERDIALFRRSKIGFVDQTTRLIEVFSAYENIILPLRIASIKVDESYLKDLITRLGLEECIRRFPSELSGGERQRVALARAVISRPELLLADEPTANLDRKNGTEVMKLMLQLNKVYGQTVIFSTHDEEKAMTAPRRLVLSDGMLISDTRSKDVG